MNRFIEFKKLSKKKQKEINKRKRNFWHMSPVTRLEPDPKAYNRNVIRRELNEL